MASVASILAGFLALSGPAGARILPSIPSPLKVHSEGDNLINLRRDASQVPDESPIIIGASPNHVLKPIRPIQSASSKITSKGSVDILNKNSLYWAGNDGTAAELLVNLPGETEGMVDTELFEDLIESMDCPRNGSSVSINFEDKLDFDSTADVWKWVNLSPDHHFTLMVGAGLCGWNEDRILYHVKGLDFIDETNTVVLNAEATTWKKAIHSYDLNIGKIASQGQGAQRLKNKRYLTEALSTRGDDSPDFSIPMDADLSSKGITFSMSGIDFTGFCTNCTTSGSFDVDAHFSVSWFELDEASVEISTQGIDATVIMDVTVQGKLTDDLAKKSIDLFKASPGGIHIPGIVTIGPTVGIALTAGVDAIKGGVKFTVGGTATIPPSTATLDFLNQDGTTSEGWEPTFEPIPFEVDLFVQARASVALVPSVGLEISAFETGFAAELSAEVPALAAVIKAIHSPTCGACDKYQNAVEGSIGFSTSIGVALQKKVADKLEDLWSLTFFDVKGPPLASMCEPIGPQPSQCTGSNSTYVWR